MEVALMVGLIIRVSDEVEKVERRWRRRNVRSISIDLSWSRKEVLLWFALLLMNHNPSPLREEEF